MKKSLSETLKDGGIAIVATDTIYGIVGRALEIETVERIYKVKGRKPEKPFIVLISGLNDLSYFDLSLSDANISGLSKLWPGPVSIIVPCNNSRFSYLHRGTRSLAFRLPDDKKLIALINETGPLVAPSANPEGLSPAKNIGEAYGYFKEEIDLYVDGGELVSSPSTLVDLTGVSPKVLRGDDSILKFLN